MLEPVEYLQRLIALPSVNPMGQAVDSEIVAAICYEHRVTDFLAAQFDDWGIPFERHEVHPASNAAPVRENFIARLATSPAQPTIMLEVHQDTVPVKGMTVEPFAGELSGGQVWGRGACDVKGAMACILSAVSRLAKDPPAGMPNIVVACTVNEEHGFTGAQALAQLWRSGKSKLLPCAPDAIIVSEPTELQVVVAHKGVVRWKCHTHGKAAHSSDPSRGENAILKMRTVLDAFSRYAQEVPELGEHPRLGRPTLSIGTIHGGVSVNTVPDRCTIEIDRRLLPDEEPHDAWNHAVKFVDEAAASSGVATSHDEPYIVARGLRDDLNDRLAESVISAVRTCGVESQAIGVPFGTDASAFGEEAPTVVFGPGSIAQAHTVDEWIAVDQLEKATEVLVEVCRRGSPV